ncbi:hypothetical protein [Methylobacterium trifolii]|uniref:Response regulatory domain-containing protein n=1 Tax=Methylobacterium trifolii TaxID=1003092 RepID=A0ABQ4TYG3_9HYPH|nr:hypothetical protein [Methylobacterium trifolii]GJE59569.1 hypothetical protein MPOCJGCO_1665 [Methylobacterium trifolii]
MIAMTAKVPPSEIRQFREAGMDDHVGKPVDRAVLCATIDRRLAAPDRAPVRPGRAAEG